MSLPNYAQVRNYDINLTNEIKMVDPNSATNTKFRDAGAFPEMASDVGLSDCVYEAGVTGCNISYIQCDTQGNILSRTDDIILNQGHHLIGVAPPNSLETIHFNKCPGGPMGPYKPYETLMQEGGHILGIKSIGDITDPNEEYARGHPFKEDTSISVMTYSDSGLRCSPHPFDILAIYALYQIKE